MILSPQQRWHAREISLQSDRPIGPSNSNVALLFFSSSLSARHARQISGAWRQRRATASGFDPCALALAREVTHRPPCPTREENLRGEEGRNGTGEGASKAICSNISIRAICAPLSSTLFFGDLLRHRNSFERRAGCMESRSLASAPSTKSGAMANECHRACLTFFAKLKMNSAE